MKFHHCWPRWKISFCPPQEKSTMASPLKKSFGRSCSAIDRIVTRELHSLALPAVHRIALILCAFSFGPYWSEPFTVRASSQIHPIVALLVLVHETEKGRGRSEGVVEKEVHQRVHAAADQRRHCDVGVSQVQQIDAGGKTSLLFRRKFFACAIFLLAALLVRVLLSVSRQGLLSRLVIAFFPVTPPPRFDLSWRFFVYACARISFQ